MANLRSLSTGERITTNNVKDLKNPYTILEKVKKGEITSHYKTGGGLFDKVSFYKKNDLIKPYMHYIDEDRLDNICSKFLDDPKSMKDVFESIQKSSSYKALSGNDSKPDFDAFSKKMKENYRKFPKHLKNDIFKMYYHKISSINFEERTDKNYSQYKFIEKANNPVGKIMSETSNLKSSIFTRNVLQYFISRMTLLEYTDPNEHDKMMDSLKGSGDNDGMENLMKKMFDDKQSKDQMDKTIQDAQNLCKSLDEIMDEPTQEDLYNNSDKASGAAKLDLGELKKVGEHLAKIGLSMGSLKEAIKKLMDRSKNYFSSRDEVKYEDIFNTDNVAGIEDYMLLHPMLRKFMIEDVQIKEVNKIGKISIYIDISGSMSGTCGVTDVNGNNIDKLDFCKAFAFKLQQMDLLKDIYVFNDSVKKINPNVFSIASIGLHGGTNINKVLDHIMSNDDNAIIITDAEDNCNYYSEKAFFVGVEGCRFNHFRSDIIEKYVQKNQAVMFDGKKIYNINSKGGVIR
jgi:uncharacterized protein with von Willebrand factor type A (vWA) domain